MRKVSPWLLRRLCDSPCPQMVISLFVGGNVKIPVGKGIIGHVARTGDTILTNDARSHKLFDESHDRLLNANAKRLATIP